jgi:hypothetical protein
MALKRPIARGDKGPDVLAVKRALKKAGYGKYLVMNRSFGSGLDRQLRKFQKAHDLPADGVYGDKTHAKLRYAFDFFGLQLLSQAPSVSPEELAYKDLLMWCEAVHKAAPPYVWGGGHGEPLDSVSVSQGMDCSSSCSLVLDRAGMMPGEWAWVSGTFASNYGYPGKGEFFTIYANWEHVFIRFHKGPYWRFDTSPHGEGGRGPRLRKMPRFTSGFTMRRWPKM